MRSLFLFLLIALSAHAGEAPSLPPGVIARVGSSDITFKQLTTEMLKREGADALIQWVQEHLDGVAWSELGDDAVIMAVGGHELRKRELAAMLLQQKGAQVREELINISVVEQAVSKAGLLIDDALMASEYRLMERDFQRRLKAQGQNHVDFSSYLQVKEKMSVEQFLAQPAVRMLAGLHALVRKQIVAEIDDAKLQAKLDAERSRWDERTAVDLSVIHIAWQRDKDGQVTPESQANVQSAMRSLYEELKKKTNTFERVWEAYGKAWDASGPGGRISWVDRDGMRQDETARRIPKGVVERAFAAEGPYPVLLPPVGHEAGVDMALVHGKRPSRTVSLPEVRERLIQDILEGVLEVRTKELVAQLRRDAVITYGSLPESPR